MQPAWRPRGRRPALLRLSWLFRLFAFLSLILAGVTIFLGLIMLAMPPGDRSWVGLVVVLSAIVSGFVSYIFWMGMAELILLAIALERNTRQTRDRLPKPPPQGG